MKIRRLAPLLPAAALLGLAGCSGGSSGNASAPVTLRLGLFANITQATALVGVQEGIFAQELGPDKLTTQVFNAGPAATEALLSDAIDATYVGPNPAINAYTQSQGSAVRVISGATSGGASLVVKPSITSAADLKGKKLASPQLGNTQDVALRYWLKQNGLSTDVQGGGDVSVTPQDNATTLQTFEAGSIDGAWVPEPWVSRLVLEGHGKVLLDERSLWPGGRFPTAVLVVRTDFLSAHPDTVRRLLQGQVRANDLIRSNPSVAQQAANSELAALTGKKLTDAVLTAAWQNLSFTDDPLAPQFETAAQHARDLGLLKSTARLDGLFDLGPLNQILQAHGEGLVSASPAPAVSPT
jgi:NitT/TauT family transport system substrate-binding protein